MTAVMRMPVNLHARFGGDAPHVGHRGRDALVGQVLDQQVAVRGQRLPAAHRGVQVQAALAGKRLVQVHDEAVRRGQVLDVADRGDRAHQVEDVVDAGGARVRLLQRLEVVDEVHHHAEPRRADRLDDLPVDLRSAENGQVVGLHHHRDSGRLGGARDRAQLADQGVQAARLVVARRRAVGAGGAEAAGADQHHAGVQFAGHRQAAGDAGLNGGAHRRVGVEQALAVADAHLRQPQPGIPVALPAGAQVGCGQGGQHGAGDVKAGRRHAQSRHLLQLLAGDRARISRHQADYAEPHRRAIPVPPGRHASGSARTAGSRPPARPGSPSTPSPTPASGRRRSRRP